MVTVTLKPAIVNVLISFLCLLRNQKDSILKYVPQEIKED